jgi:hypothetical protein
MLHAPRSVESFAAMCRFCLLLCLVLIFTGCANQQSERQPFFQPEQGLDVHGRKSWFDHLVETDPGQADCVVAKDYQQNPPLRIAVLPFADRNGGQYLIDGVPVVRRSTEERQKWAWTYANRLRRTVDGYLAQREFVLVPLPMVDAALADRGITDAEKLRAVPVAQFDRWLGADAVVYGEVVDYEAYYALLVAMWRVGARVRMVSTHDGHEIFSAVDRRYAVDTHPVLDPVDFGINSALALLQLRDVTLARAEDEVGREILLRLPTARRNIMALRRQALLGVRNLDLEKGSPVSPLVPETVETPEEGAVDTPAAASQPAADLTQVRGSRR